MPIDLPIENHLASAGVRAVPDQTQAQPQAQAPADVPHVRHMSLKRRAPADLAIQPPARLGAADANFLRAPSGLAVNTIDSYLTHAERRSLAITSTGLLREISASIPFQESKAFVHAHEAWRSAQQDFRESTFGKSITDIGVARWHLDEIQARIIEARAARGVHQPHYPAYRAAVHICVDISTMTGAQLLGLEQLFVDALDAVELDPDYSVRTFHNAVWELDAQERAGTRDASATYWLRLRILKSLAPLVENLRDAMTADLLPPGEINWWSMRSPKRDVVFIQHYIDEPCAAAKTLEQTHLIDGVASTQSAPWPEPSAGISRVRFEFAPGEPQGCSYVHTFNVARPMDTPD
ncbi:hypothetical protein GHT07_02310 [Caenimonas koreensis DSM 17982]|uniref:Uncharacterized protein n=1 Tax=Caenimonas koreensis DSM 17982 TaxID=1121255 RepID=A0A844B4A9_9BURK|nr:hypothetical protein [Caenimonas koreensis]MRD46096.1 hypothetical protein [Caenimonas koreensis DSM 17982]